MNLRSGLKAAALTLSLLPLAACGMWSATNTSTTQSGCTVYAQNGQRPAPTIDRKAEYPGATTLTVDNFVADVTIIPADVKSISYTFTAQRGLTKLMTESTDDDGRSVKLGFQCQDTNTSVVIDELPRLSVTVPRGVDLNIGTIGTGTTIIGNTDGPLHATVAGTGSTIVGDISSLSLGKSGTGTMTVRSTTDVVDITQSGKGSLQVDSIQGRTEVHSSGTGDITLKGDQISYLFVDKSGTGDLTFNGHAKHAKLDSSGTGDITVSSVGTVERNSTGTGVITINRATG